MSNQLRCGRALGILDGMALSDSLLFTSDVVATGQRGDALRRAGGRAGLHRVIRGVYLPDTTWNDLDGRERYRAKIIAVVSTLRRLLVVSHWSAAALWGFPVLDSWPDVVHALDTGRTTGKRTSNLARHPGRPDARAVDLDGIVCTSAARTAVDVALAEGYVAATAMFDHGLKEGLFVVDDVHAELSSRPTARRLRSALAALSIASPLSESFGESVSKAHLHLLGFPHPELQRQFEGQDGRTRRVDFFWPERRLVGEFDGEAKYLDPALLRGRTTERALLDEKWRDEALRAHPSVESVVHWGYATARNPARLAAALSAAGLRRFRTPDALANLR